MKPAAHQAIDVAVTGLAAWRLSSLLVREDGPWQVLHHMRALSGMVYDNNGELLAWPAWSPLHCVWCTSLWTAIGLYLLPRSISRILAAAAIAIIVETHTNGHS